MVKPADEGKYELLPGTLEYVFHVTTAGSLAGQLEFDNQLINKSTFLGHEYPKIPELGLYRTPTTFENPHDLVQPFRRCSVAL